MPRGSQVGGPGSASDRGVGPDGGRADRGDNGLNIGGGRPVMTRNGPLTTKNGPVTHSRDKNKDRGGAKTKGRTSTRAGSLAGAYGALGHSLGLAGIGNIGGLFGGVTSDSEEGEGVDAGAMVDAYNEASTTMTEAGVMNIGGTFGTGIGEAMDRNAVEAFLGIERDLEVDGGPIGKRGKGWDIDRSWNPMDSPALGLGLSLVNPFLGAAYNIGSAVYNGDEVGGFLSGAGAIANFSANPVVGLGTGLLSLGVEGYETFTGDSLNDLAGGGTTPDSKGSRGDTGKKAAPKSKAPAVANVAQQQDDSPFSGIWNLGNSDSKRGTQKLGPANIGRATYSGFSLG